MSDTPTGPGSWQASDGRWYPPETHADPAYRAQWAAAAPGGPPPPGSGGYPVGYELDGPRKIARWRAFVHILMLIPHWIVHGVLTYAFYGVAVISWFAILFTGRLPAGLANFQVMFLRYQNRIFSFAVLLHDTYPPFEFDAVGADPGGTPDRTWAAPEVENRNRLTTFFRLILVIPHVVVLYVLTLIALILYVIGWFGVLFTGKMPDGIARYLIGVGRWTTRAWGYGVLLTDKYPPFTLDPA